jgi:hypothetical protein
MRQVQDAFQRGLRKQFFVDHGLGPAAQAVFRATQIPFEAHVADVAFRHGYDDRPVGEILVLHNGKKQGITPRPRYSVVIRSVCCIRSPTVISRFANGVSKADTSSKGVACTAVTSK